MQTLNLQPPTMEWRLYRYDTSNMTLLLVDENDAPLDLSAWEFTGFVKEFPGVEEAIAELQIEKNENALLINLTNDNLVAMSYFDIQGTNTITGQVSTIVRGQIFIEEDVTG